MKGAFIVALATLALAACGESRPSGPVDPSLIIESRVAFVETDYKTPRQAPGERLRLWMPYVVGDLFGAPNEGEVLPVTLNADLSFRLDLEEAGAKLERGLVPTQFSQQWMAIQPAEARVARMLPFVLPDDHIVPVGLSDWLDEETGARLLLLYIDRPARIVGDIIYDGRPLKFDIVAERAGYLWTHQPAGEGTYRTAPWPRKLVLAVTPGE